MGMRATFAHIDTKGTLNMTSVQWCTGIDKNLSLALRDHKDPASALSRLFKKVTTSFDHISALDLVPADYVGARNVKMGYGFYAQGPQIDEDDDYKVKSRYTDTEATKAGGHYRLIQNFHTEDGLSVVVDQRDPEQITFAWEDYNKGLVWQTVKVSDLVAEGFESDYRKG